MPLSNYLTDAEWDACFYAFFGQHHADNFGASMLRTLDYLRSRGYRFAGLDGPEGPEFVESRNMEKVVAIMGGPAALDIPAVLDSGRSFLKQHAPDLVDETDEEWAAQQADALSRQQGYRQA